MTYEDPTASQAESSPERIPSREEVISKLHSYCESFEIDLELADAEGVYLLRVRAADNSKLFTYQRKGTFQAESKEIGSAGTTIRSEDLDDGYARTLADYNPATNEWVEQ